MIRFTKLRYKNFLSTGNKFTELKLDSNKTTLVVGNNGSGKSSWCDAVTFVLFNKPFRKINKPQLLNSITQKELVVEIEFLVGSNEYKVVRGIKPNVFEVYKNRTLLNQSADAKDYQSILEKQILKVNYRAFCQVVILGSASFVPFMELPLGQRREIIEELLDLQIFSTMNVLLRDKISSNNLKINQLETDGKLVEQKIQLTKKHLKELQQVSNRLISEKKELIVDTEQQIDKLVQACNKLEQELKIETAKTSDESKLKSKLKKLDQIKHQLEHKISQSKSDISFFTKHENCPTCKQTIDEAFKCEVIETKSSIIEETENGLELLLSEYNNVEEQINIIFNITKNITELKLQIHTIKTKMSSLLDYKEQLSNDLKKLSDVKTSNTTDKQSIQELEAEYKHIGIQHQAHLFEKQNLSVVSSLLKDTGIKSKIIRQYVPIMNKLINKYLSALEFMVHFELNESFEETIKSRFRDEFSYASFSEGEKTRINLAILFAWRAVAKMRNSIDTNLLIMDEVLDSALDSNGTDELMKILNELTKDTNTFIISHKGDQLFDRFDRVLKFEKVKNFSVLT
jgi:DNA repair exonuclease SbcCD ATPase subunit